MVDAARLRAILSRLRASRERLRPYAEKKVDEYISATEGVYASKYLPSFPDYGDLSRSGIFEAVAGFRTSAMNLCARMGADPTAVASTIVLDGEAFEVVGVLPCCSLASGSMVCWHMRLRRGPRKRGIRMALGASSGDIRREMLWRACVTIGPGVMLGIAAALLMLPAFATFLAGISPYDPAAFLAGVTLLLFAGLAAGYMPARRAARVDPMQALRRL